MDLVVFVSATPEKRLRRNASRGWDAAEIKRRESRLMPRDEKIRRVRLGPGELRNERGMGSQGQGAGKIFLEKERSSRS